MSNFDTSTGISGCWIQNSVMLTDLSCGSHLTHDPATYDFTVGRWGQSLTTVDSSETLSTFDISGFVTYDMKEEHKTNLMANPCTNTLSSTPSETTNSIWFIDGSLYSFDVVLSAVRTYTALSTSNTCNEL